MLQSAVFGGGCFWCIEAAFSRLRGVEKVTSGYVGGEKPNPTYDEVCAGGSGYVEVVNIDYDPQAISYADLLGVFFAMHDPTSLNRQGNDVGEQYASVIFTSRDDEKREAQYSINQLARDAVFPKPIVTQIRPLTAFYPADASHQRYYDNNREAPYCTVMIDPKIVKLRQTFAHLLKPNV